MLVVVGGNSRNIGKTSVAASIIRGTVQLGWTALRLRSMGTGDVLGVWMNWSSGKCW